MLAEGNKLREQVEVSYFFVPEVRRQQHQRGRHICYAMFTLTGRRISTGVFFMHAIRIIPSILYQPLLFQNCELKKRALNLSVFSLSMTACFCRASVQL